VFLAHLCKQSQAFPPPKKGGTENSQQETNESIKVSEVDLSVFQALCVLHQKWRSATRGFSQIWLQDTK
jgi:hypothetical protein